MKIAIKSSCCRLALLFVPGWLSLKAQSAEIYTGHSFSEDGGTIYAYETLDASMSSGNCTHNYDMYVDLSGPPGTTEIGGGGGGAADEPTSSPYSSTINAQIASSLAGAYSFGTSGSAYCNCIEETYYNDPYNVEPILNTEPPSINAGGIVVYPSTGGTISDIEPGSTGVLVIYGQYLTAGGQDMNPEVEVTNGVTLGEFQSIQDSQLNVNYDASGASPGQATVTVTTNVNPPAKATIAIGDMTPVITSVSETTFYVDDAASFTISGTHFGSKCSVSFPFTANVQSVSCSDSSISVTNMTPTGAGTGEITVTSEGYGGQSFDPAPGQQSKSGSSPQVTANAPKTFTVDYQAWIPFDHVVGFSSCYYAPYTVTYLYNGNPNTGTFAGGYKATETVQVTPDSGTYRGFYQDTGETYQFAYLSPKNGSTLSQADLDNKYFDCYLFNNEAKATPGFSYSVTFPYPHQAQILFTGSVGNPLETAAGPIRWTVRTVIDTTNPTNTQSYVNYNTTCFPAHEVVVNSTTLWSYVPTSSTPLYISSCLGSAVSPAVNPVIGQTNSITIP